MSDPNRTVPPSATPTLRAVACAAVFAAALVAQSAQSIAGHARARELAELGRLPQARDVVVRDIVNYHRHRVPLPRAGQPVALDLRFDRSHARSGDEVVLQAGYTTQTTGDLTDAPPCSVALVVDCSGSMADLGKMAQVQAGLRAFVEHLRPDDEVAIVTFSDDARIAAPLRARRDGERLRATIDELRPDRSTNLEAGLRLGVDALADARHRSRRVVLLTDGIANRGVTNPDEILRSVQRRDGRAVDVSTIGVGQDLDMSLLQRLADGNRGLFHYVADTRDVQKVFVREVESLLLPAARDVELRVTLPADLRATHVFESNAHVTRDGTEVRVRMPDLNAGVTGVVLISCRVRGELREPGSCVAELSFDGVTTGERQRVPAEARLPRRLDRREAREAVDATATTDHEVRRNHAIALLADGMARMADACERRRWADADRALQAARDRAAEVFPGDDDDVQRVRDIAADYARTLRRYVDRFRDF